MTASKIIFRFSPLLILLILSALLVFPCATQAQTYNVLYSFGGSLSGPPTHDTTLIQSGGVLYGMTSPRHADDLSSIDANGTIFSFNPDTNTQTIVHVFTGLTIDGAGPVASLIQSGNTLYGVTSSNIFSFNADNNTESVLHNFPLHNAPSSDGIVPSGSLVQSGSVLYGMTFSGGSAGRGTVYAFDTATSTQIILHSFQGIAPDGSSPLGSLIQSGGVLYGMTTNGGNDDLGTIFKYDITSATSTVLHLFTGGPADGATPLYGSLIQSGDKLFGVTPSGGANGAGILFVYDIASGTETLLHSFAGGSDDGAVPQGSLIQSGDILYGMTYHGGTNNLGTVYSFDTTTDTLTIIHEFNGFDGALPTGGLLLVGDELYGIADYGGINYQSNLTIPNGSGIIFSISLPEPSSVILLGFGVITVLRKRRRI